MTLSAVNDAIVEATVKIARRKGLDVARTRAHMVITLAMLGTARETFLKLEQEKLLIWSSVYR